MSGSAIKNLVRLSRRGLLSVRGSDAPEFLNGMLAATIAKPPRIAPGYSVILNAQGRILYDVFVHLHPEFSKEPAPHFILEYSSASPISSASEDGTQSPTSIPTLPKLLRRHLLRSDVRIRDLTSEYGVWAAWTEPHTEKREWQWSVARSGVIEPVFDAGVEGTDGAGVWGGPGLLKDRRAAGMGTRRLVRKGDKPPEHETHEVKALKSYLLHRIRHGVPEGPIDLPPGQSFPFESNIDMMGGVSVRKGCYIGQELTSRTYHTGVVRKRIVPVTLQPDPSSTADDPSPSFRPHLSIKASHLAPPGDSGSPRRPRPRGSGKLLTNTDGHGLALLRLEHVGAALRGEVALELDYNLEQGNVTSGLPDEWAGGEMGAEHPVRLLEDEKRRWLVRPRWQDGLPASKDEVESNGDA